MNESAPMPSSVAGGKASAGKRVSFGPLLAIVGFLAFVEFTSGILQGYYIPIFTDIGRHLNVSDADVNWLAAGQLTLSALTVPLFAKLGDMFGYRRMLVIAMAITAAAMLSLPFVTSFWLFLLGYSLLGFHTVWLPLEIALIWSRTKGWEGRSQLTYRAAGILVAFLELGAISGAVAGGALVEMLDFWVVLLVPAVCVTLGVVVVFFGVREDGTHEGGRVDTMGMVLISLALVFFMGGLSLLRLNGAADLLSWAVVALGIVLIVPFARWELRQSDPLINVRMFASRSLAPLYLTAALFGVSMLGGQVPLSTFARTDPATYGFGLGASGLETSMLIGVYLIATATGALLYPMVSRHLSPRVALIGGCLIIGGGYLLFVPLHHYYWLVVSNMVWVGIGSGALIAALPGAAAATADASETAMATGLTNSTKTMGGAIASCVFGIALLQGVSEVAADGVGGSLEGYMTVWIVCSVTAFISAILLVLVPRDAFQDAPALPNEDEAGG